MNSNLEKLDEQVKLIVEKLDSKMIEKWAHSGFSDYMRDTSLLIKEDIHLFEESFKTYEENSSRAIILGKLRAILNDAKNLLLSRDIDQGVDDFIEEFLVLANNWNMMYNEDLNVTADIEAVLRILEIQGSMSGLLQRLEHVSTVIEELLMKNTESNPFKTSSTYLKAIKSSLIKSDEEADE